MNSLGREQFKTVDQLMEWVIDYHKRVTIPPITIYNFLELEDYIQIRNMLMTKENKPSVHDIGIISEIARDYKILNNGFQRKEWSIIAKDILKLYSERK